MSITEVLSKDTKGCLVCFEGIDGSGKTTIAHSVKQQLLTEGVPSILVSRNYLIGCPDFAESRLRVLGELLWDYPDNLPVRVLGDRHLIHLLVSWFQLFDTWVIQPLLDAPGVVLIDTWFYKYVARFTLKQDFSGATVQSWFDGLTIPDVVLWLSTQPDTALRRKGKPRQTEFEQVPGNNVSNIEECFLTYQTGVQAALAEFAISNQWKKIDATPSIEEVTASSIEAIRSTVALRWSETHCAELDSPFFKRRSRGQLGATSRHTRNAD